MKAIDRIYEYIDFKSISINEFSLVIGVSNGYLAKQKAANANIGSHIIEKIVINFPEINTDWLMTGQGSMLRDNQVEFRDSAQENPPLIGEYSKRYEKRFERQEIPLYDIDASAGLVGLLADTKVIPLDYISIPDMSKVDGAVYVKGDSMYPILKSGDIILYSQIHNFDYISYGDIYLLSFFFDEEEYVCVKYVQKATKKGYVKLVSHNKHHSDQQIPIANIRALALVKASIRYNTMR